MEGAGHNFFEKIGFWDKWIPEEVNQLKDLFDRKAAVFFIGMGALTNTFFCTSFF